MPPRVGAKVNNRDWTFMSIINNQSDVFAPKKPTNVHFKQQHFHKFIQVEQPRLNECWKGCSLQVIGGL